MARCPKCGNKLRTELALQCFSCGARWKGPPRKVPKASVRKDDLQEAWGVGLFLGVVAVVMVIGGIMGSDTQEPSTEPQRTSAKEMLRANYDAQGIEYDEKMLDEDARAVEDLARDYPDFHP